MLDFIVASAVIIIVARLIEMPWALVFLVILLFGVGWYLIGDE